MDIFKTLGLGAPRRYYGGNSGYVGYSKSKRAVAAEENGLRSKSNMDRAFANEVNKIIVERGGKPVTLKAIKDATSKVRADEWHHTSMYGNKTDYYSAETMATYFIPEKKHIPTAAETIRAKKINALCKKIRDYYFKKMSNPFTPFDHWKYTYLASNGVRLGLDDIEAIGNGQVSNFDFAYWINGSRYNYKNDPSFRKAADNAVSEFWTYTNTVIPKELPDDLKSEISALQ